MNCLPIVDRELRVAARRRSTFWIRLLGAITGLVIGAACLALSYWQGTTSTRMGATLFSILTWICLGGVLSAGLFFTSDCLSEEKREGTLGLLFLTELRGYDVVFGKLLATSLRGFYALLAILPIIAVTQLMGGITGAQYWKSSLALVNALWCSLAAGVLVSCISRDSQKALAAALLLLLLLTLGGPVADGALAALAKKSFVPFWSMTSPAYALVTASAWGRSAYWGTLFTTGILSWTMLALACALVPRTWQDRRRAGRGSSRDLSYVWKYGGTKRREKLRASLMEREPVAWLACRERWQSLTLWIMTLSIAGIFIAMLTLDVAMGTWMAWSYVGGIFVLVLYLWAASQAVRFSHEARRSGLTELLMVTPLAEREIVTGQWRALFRMFGLPILVLMAVQVTGAVLSQVYWNQLSSQMSAATTSATNQAGATTNQTIVWSSTVTVGSSTNVVVTGKSALTSRSLFPKGGSIRLTPPMIIAGAAAALGLAGNLIALCWFGMWMGLTSRSANLATLKTIAFVQVIPWFVIAFGSTILAGMWMASLSIAGQPTGWFTWWPVLSAALNTILALLKDIGFILWARKKLYSEFREQVSRIPGQPRLVAPPIILPSQARA